MTGRPYLRPAYDDPARAPEPPAHDRECGDCRHWQRDGATEWGTCQHLVALTHQWLGCVDFQPREEVAS